MNVSRVWAMPHHYTFTIGPIRALLERVMAGGGTWVDPFAGQHSPAHVRNDLNPDTPAEFHLLAEDFAAQVAGPFDGVLFDPPYSPRQISEVYKRVGLVVGMKETQSARLYASVRDSLAPKIRPGGLAISFGWNSVGFGKGRGFEIEEILLVCHGGAHNDTICTVERKVLTRQTALPLEDTPPCSAR